MISGSLVVPFQNGPYFCWPTRDERLGFLLPLLEAAVVVLVLFLLIFFIFESPSSHNTKVNRKFKKKIFLNFLNWYHTLDTTWYFSGLWCGTSTSSSKCRLVVVGTRYQMLAVLFRAYRRTVKPLSPDTSIPKTWDCTDLWGIFSRFFIFFLIFFLLIRTIRTNFNIFCSSTDYTF